MLENIVVKSKTIEVEYPYIDGGFKVQIAYLTKDEVLAIKKRATKTKLVIGSRIPEEELDEDLFTQLFVPAIVKGWSGLTFKIFSQMLPINEDAIEDMSAEIPYDKSDLLFLMRNAANFDTWVSEIANDLSAFTKGA